MVIQNIAEIPYEPRGAARDLFWCRESEVLLEGPAGTGKTRALLEYVYWCCRTFPGIRVLFIRKTRASLTESVLVTWEQKVLPDHACITGTASAENRRSYTFPWDANRVYGTTFHPGGDAQVDADHVDRVRPDLCLRSERDRGSGVGSAPHSEPELPHALAAGHRGHQPRYGSPLAPHASESRLLGARGARRGPPRCRTWAKADGEASLPPHRQSDAVGPRAGPVDGCRRSLHAEAPFPHRTPQGPPPSGRVGRC